MGGKRTGQTSLLDLSADRPPSKVLQQCIRLLGRDCGAYLTTSMAALAYGQPRVAASLARIAAALADELATTGTLAEIVLPSEE